jgi:uncharacterized sporulation protein YeaH/YhbH (DUF444 family)
MGGGGKEVTTATATDVRVLDIEDIAVDADNSSDFEPVVGNFGGAGVDDDDDEEQADKKKNKADKKKKKADGEGSTKQSATATTSETLSFIFHDGELKTKLIFVLGVIAAIGNGLVRKT